MWYHLYTFSPKFEPSQPLQQWLQLARFPLNVLFWISNLWFRLISMRHLLVAHKKIAPNECDYWNNLANTRGWSSLETFVLSPSCMTSLPRWVICCNICFFTSPVHFLWAFQRICRQKNAFQCVAMLFPVCYFNRCYCGRKKKYPLQGYILFELLY